MASLSSPLQLRCSAFTPLPACQPPDSSTHSAFLLCLHALGMHACIRARTRAHVCVRAVPRQQAPGGDLEAGRSAWHIHLLLPAMGVGAAAAATYGCSAHVIVVVVVFRRIYFSVCGANVHAATAVPCWCFSFNRQAQSWPLPQLRLASGFFAFHPHHPRCAKKRASLCAAHT